VFDFQEVPVTRFALCLVAVTASLGLAAQEKPSLAYSPCEVQIGASLVSYDPQTVTGPNGSADFTPKGLGMAPSLKVSVDMVPFKIGPLDASVLFSAGWRFANDVPLEWDGANVPLDLQHKSQMSLGALLKVNFNKNLDFGVGLDERQDWMLAGGLAGTDSQESVWRPWLRAQARYLFDRGAGLTPFVGAEFAFALAPVEVNPINYHRDYVINTGWELLGPIYGPSPSPESLARGHMPLWDLAVVVGVRFGRHCD
jgi:hypothetical protein